MQGAGGLATAFHFYHSDAANQNGWNVRIERLHVSGTQQAIMLWDATLHDITIDTADITGASRFAIRYEGGHRHHHRQRHLDGLRIGRLLELQGLRTGRRDLPGQQP